MREGDLRLTEPQGRGERSDALQGYRLKAFLSQERKRGRGNKSGAPKGGKEGESSRGHCTRSLEGRVRTGLSIGSYGREDEAEVEKLPVKGLCPEALPTCPKSCFLLLGPGFPQTLSGEWQGGLKHDAPSSPVPWSDPCASPSVPNSPAAKTSGSQPLSGSSGLPSPARLCSSRSSLLHLCGNTFFSSPPVRYTQTGIKFRT